MGKRDSFIMDPREAGPRGGCKQAHWSNAARAPPIPECGVPGSAKPPAPRTENVDGGATVIAGGIGEGVDRP